MQVCRCSWKPKVVLYSLGLAIINCPMRVLGAKFFSSGEAWVFLPLVPSGQPLSWAVHTSAGSKCRWSCLFAISSVPFFSYWFLIFFSPSFKDKILLTCPSWPWTQVVIPKVPEFVFLLPQYPLSSWYCRPAPSGLYIFCYFVFKESWVLLCNLVYLHISPTFPTWILGLQVHTTASTTIPYAILLLS